jgi:sugar phosphate isomerase/epimerase
MRLSTSISSAVCYCFSKTEDQLRHITGNGFRVFDFGFDRLNEEALVKGAVSENFSSIRDTLSRLDAVCGQSHSIIFNPFIQNNLPELLALVNKELEVCNYLGIRRMVVHPGMKPGNSRDEFFSLNRNFFSGLIPMAERWDTEVLVENIGSPGDLYYFVRSGQELRELVDCIDHPLIGACWDTGHANHHKQFDQYDSITALGDKLKALHIQDNFGSYDLKEKCSLADLHTLPFFGNTNYDSVMQGLLDIGYQGTFSFETEVPRKRSDRLNFVYHGTEIQKLSMPSPLILEHIGKLLYETGKHFLTVYGCFEE